QRARHQHRAHRRRDRAHPGAVERGERADRAGDRRRPLRARHRRGQVRTATVILLLCAACPAASPAVKSQTAVKVRQLEKGGAAQGQRYSATITAGSRVDLSFKNGGYVEHLCELKGVDGAPRAIQEGDPVKAGQELARVRKKDFEHKLAEARASLAE